MWIIDASEESSYRTRALGKKMGPSVGSRKGLSMMFGEDLCLSGCH